ncbi:alpha/beta hydrolase fold domain-containing protein [Streptomyces sp. YC419]|uniref:Alpha/beta hydrolase fold domain-containing protein n=1 Tax=Streptomyces ureilyticus TaxID=1775131 RepID=A0ABX0DSZ2_9ACTN|nr:alpha/beta hydrolase fold domain-containing protein [Streptomyces ureilyticus]
MRPRDRQRDHGDQRRDGQDSQQGTAGVLPGGLDRRHGHRGPDTRINLDRADLSGLPPTLVSWGTYEVLAGEDEEFAARVKDAGIDTATVVVPGGQHSYVYGAGRVPEVDAAIAQIGAWVREKTKI